MSMTCPKCLDTGYVCEKHPDIVWQKIDGTTCCGGAGMRCECEKLQIAIDALKFYAEWKNHAKQRDDFGIDHIPIVRDCGGLAREALKKLGVE